MTDDFGEYHLEQEEALSQESDLAQTNETNAHSRWADWRHERAMQFTDEFLRREGIVVRADRSFEIRGELGRAETADDIAGVLRLPKFNFNELRDRQRLSAAANGFRIKDALLDAALKQVVEVHAAARRGAILEKLYVELEGEQKVAADLEWLKWASVFDMDPVLSIAITKHFIWQLKRKAIGLPVHRHLAPVIYSAAQGTGKSTAVRKLVEPLEEIGQCVILVDQLSDSRGSAFEDVLAFLDDLGFANAQQAANLKAMITADKIRQRKMQSSQMQNILQRCTLIATSNRPIWELIPDPTGHRRFPMLPFKNGQVDAGGEPHVFPTITNLKSLLLWQSVNVFDRSQIDAVIPQLLAHQGGVQRESSVYRWLRNLDVSSHAAKNLRTKQGIPVRDFFNLYAEQSGIQNDDRSVSTAFFQEMQQAIKENWCPVTYKATKIGRFYVPKAAPISGVRVTQDASPLSPLSSPDRCEDGIQP